MDVGLVCDECSTLAPMGTERCARCGYSLSLDEETQVGGLEFRGPAQPKLAAAQRCAECGALIIPGHRFCGACGVRVEIAKPAPQRDPDKSQRQTRFFSAMQGSHARLTLIRGDGHDGVSFTLAGEDHLVGRVDCPILFAEDPFLSPVHANFFYREGHLFVRDEASRNGVFVRIHGTTRIHPGTRFLTGEQVLELQEIPEVNDDATEDGTYFFASPRRGVILRVVQILPGGISGQIACSTGAPLRIGRNGNDLNFPDDHFLSGHHAQIESNGVGLALTDLASKNGTFLQISGEQRLAHGDFVFLGQQLLRVEIV